MYSMYMMFSMYNNVIQQKVEKNGDTNSELLMTYKKCFSWGFFSVSNALVST